MIKKVENLKEKDESLYNQKITELTNTIGKDKVEKKLKDIDKKYGNQLNDYVKKVGEFNKNASKEEKAKMILEMKQKLSKEDQKKFDKLLKMFANYMKDI